LTIGWGDEPAFSGFRNSVEVDVADNTGATPLCADHASARRESSAPTNGIPSRESPTLITSR